MNSPSPVLLGYQRLRVDASPDAVENDRRVMAAFARREGFCLGEVFTELEGQMRALARVVSVSVSGVGVGVVVASECDLGRLPRTRSITRELFAERGIRLLVAQELGVATRVLGMSRA